MKTEAFASGLLFVCAAVLAGHATADDPREKRTLDVTGISFEELLNTTITSVSKREESYRGAAAAVYVLSNEDLRRAHVTNIPDALRLVPGVHVLQSQAHDWNVTIRGFSGFDPNKLLVLFDGRTSYDLLFGGTFWEIQDYPLEDIDRIEVIRGPGGTLWGSNAVNGVINIVSKSSAATQGSLAVAGAGSKEGVALYRQGLDLGEGRTLRLYGQYRGGEESWHPTVSKDDWRDARGGFRMDSQIGDTTSFTLQGDLFNAAKGPPNGNTAPVATTPESRFFGGNLLARWKRRPSGGDADELQLYFDYVDHDLVGTLEEQRAVIDLEYHRSTVRGRHTWVVGGGFRWVADHVSVDATNPLSFAGGFSPQNHEERIWNAFAQDEIEIIEDQLKVVLGAKLERNGFTGDEVQPTARFAWTPADAGTVWGAVSRAVRIPTRFDQDFPALNNRALKAEELLAWELGYRNFMTRRWQLDATIFLNDYDNLISFEAAPTITGFGSVNALKGQVYGLELSNQWAARDNWRLELNYTLHEVQLQYKNGEATAVGSDAIVESLDAEQIISFQSHFDPRPDLQFDTILRFVDNIPAAGTNRPVDAYVALDLGVNWQPQPGLELSLSARNLLDDHHPERSTRTAFVAVTVPNEVPHTVMGKVTWHF